MIKSEYLIALRSTAEFQALLAQIKKHRPTIPVYDAQSDNTEEWKANSYTQRGFDLCLTYFGEKTDE